MDAQLEEYLRRRRQPLAMEEEDVESSDPGDMDRSLSPEPLALRERPRFDNLMAGLDAPRLQAEADVALERDAADDVADMAGRRLGKDSVFAPREAGTFSPLAAGRGVPAPNDEGSGGGYLAALRRAQKMDDLSAGMRRVYDSGQQLAEITSRGAYKAQPLGDMPSEVSKEEKRRAVVAEYLKQKRDDETAGVDAEYKRGLLKRMADGKPQTTRPGLTQEQFDAEHGLKLTDLAGRIAARNQPRTGKQAKPADTGPKLNKAAETLRKEFNGLPVVKDFNDVDAAYGKMKRASESPSAAGDLSLIFGYMKMLDPGSTVREGEFANAQNAGGVDDKVASAYNQVVDGQRLTPDQRKDFLGRARQLYDTHAEQLNTAAERYSGIAKKSGADPEDVVIRPKTGGNPAGKVAVSNGSETLYIDPQDVPDAAKDGYKVVKP
jgi:hypothetical protein